MRVWLTAMATPEVNVEHEFTSALLNQDRLRQPLLVNLPCRAEEDGQYKLTAKVLDECRLPMLESESIPVLPATLYAQPRLSSILPWLSPRFVLSLVATAVGRNLVGLIERIPQSPKEKQNVAVGLNGIIGTLVEMKEQSEVRVSSLRCEMRVDTRLQSSYKSNFLNLSHVGAGITELITDAPRKLSRVLS